MARPQLTIPSFTPAWRATVRAGRHLTIFIVATALFFAQTANSFAVGLIRDSEIETLLADYASPIFKAANVGSQNVHIHIIDDKTFNAYVIDGHNMFIHVGAITQCDTPNQLIGIIAHETGHIAGGHLARLRQQMANMQSAALIMNIIGLGAMVGGAVSGGGEVGQAGAAVLYGGNTIVQRSILSYRRVMESSADQAGVSFLTRTKQSADGMLETFRHLADQSLASISYIDPYLQTHPMPQERLVQLRELAERSPYFGQKDPPELQFRHDMMRAKLEAFTNKNNARYVLRKYPEKDQTLPARYARAITTYFTAGMDKAMGEINGLIAAQPNNPYFYELKGQFLLESGRVRESIPALRQSVSLAPHAGLIRVMLGQALVSTNDDSLIKEAIGDLQKALVEEDQSVIGYRELAIAYSRLNRIPEAQLASAQSFFYEGNADFAKVHAERAITAFAEGSPNWMKANDIISDVDTYKKLASK